MAWFEHNGSRIYYEEQGTGTAVLVLPGFAGNIEEFAVLREALVGAGYRVIAADLPGSGRSEPQPRAYTATFFEDDAGSFTALLQHLATGPAHLMGFSDGGEISLLMAALTPGIARSSTSGLPRMRLTTRSPSPTASPRSSCRTPTHSVPTSAV